MQTFQTKYRFYVILRYHFCEISRELIGFFFCIHISPPLKERYFTITLLYLCVVNVGSRSNAGQCCEENAVEIARGNVCGKSVVNGNPPNGGWKRADEHGSKSAIVVGR